MTETFGVRESCSRFYGDNSAETNDAVRLRPSVGYCLWLSSESGGKTAALHKLLSLIMLLTG